MEKIKTQEVYVPVDVNENLPEKGLEVHVIKNINGKIYNDALHRMKHSGKWFDYNKEVTHWLEPQTDKYLLSKEDIIKLVGDAIDAGRKIEYNIHFGAVPTLVKSKQTYIDNLFK